MKNLILKFSFTNSIYFIYHYIRYALSCYRAMLVEPNPDRILILLAQHKNYLRGIRNAWNQMFKKSRKSSSTPDRRKPIEINIDGGIHVIYTNQSKENIKSSLDSIQKKYGTDVSDLLKQYK